MLMIPTDSGTLDCRAFYVGLGLMHGRDGEVLEVATNGPADQAGIRPGDVLVNHYHIYPDAKPEGEIVRVEFTRGGVHHMRMVRVGRICYT